MIADSSYFTFLASIFQSVVILKGSMHLKKIYMLSATTAQFITRMVIFAGIIFGFYVLYKLLLEQALDGSKQIIPVLLLWILSAYIVVPRIHRVLNKFYLPNYFVGRIRSPSGFLSDPVNIALIGQEKDVHTAMQKAGWQRADKLTLKSFLRVTYSALLGKSYPNAPVGDMFLFNRPYDFAYQVEVNGSPNERHHVRFWKTPSKWYLPGGYTSDWLGAASYDTRVGIKIATGQIDHFIHENVDEERDYLIKTLQKSGLTKGVKMVKHFTNAYHDRNNGGDRIKTDGSLPFVTL